MCLCIYFWITNKLHGLWTWEDRGALTPPLFDHSLKNNFNICLQLHCMFNLMCSLSLYDHIPRWNWSVTLARGQEVLTIFMIKHFLFTDINLAWSCIIKVILPTTTKIILFTIITEGLLIFFVTSTGCPPPLLKLLYSPWVDNITF